MKYYTLESFDGRVYKICATKREAKKDCREYAETGICYRRYIGKDKVKQEFIWI